jgi:hypothetical protein
MLKCVYAFHKAFEHGISPIYTVRKYLLVGCFLVHNKACASVAKGWQLTRILPLLVRNTLTQPNGRTLSFGTVTTFICSNRLINFNIVTPV